MILKLKQNSSGEYTRDNHPVTPVLVSGPYFNSYDIVNGKLFSDDEVVRGVILGLKESGINLEKLADSYTSAGCIVRVARIDRTGKPIMPEEKRMDVISFYKSIPKGLN